MIDGIPIGDIATGGGITVLLVGLFWMLATGRLVTRREADDIGKDRDVWRQMALDQKGLVSQLLAGQETTNRLLRALPRIGEVEDA